MVQFTLASKKPCTKKCGYVDCGKGKHCVVDKEKCTTACVCSITCANVFCAYGNCVHDPKTCDTKCGKFAFNL